MDGGDEGRSGASPEDRRALPDGGSRDDAPADGDPSGDGGGSSDRADEQSGEEEQAPAGDDDAGAGESEAAEHANGGIPITRRQAFAGTGLLALVGLGLGVSHVLRGARTVDPEVPAEQLQGEDWVLAEELQESVLQDSAGPIAIEAIGSTVRYENQGLVADIRDSEVEIEFRGETGTERLGDHAGGQFDQSMGVFVATKIDLTPHVDELPAGIGRAQVMDPVETQSREQFAQQLREAGLEDVREVDPTVAFEPDAGGSAAFFEYRGTFTFEGAAVEVRGVPITFSGGGIEIAGYLAVWHDGRNVLIAAGAHPNENYTETVTQTTAGDELTASVDLGLRPAELREEVLGYMAAVE